MIRLSIDALALLRAFQSGYWAVIMDATGVWLFDPARCEEPARRHPRVWLTELAYNGLVTSADDVWMISEAGRQI